jgi:hypothetical protein
MIESPRKQIHQPPDQLLARIRLASHYRYFTAFVGSA